jgi:hypothetical protein
MAITIQGTATRAEAATGTSLVLAMPTGATTGETLIMAVVTDTSAAVPNQAGWVPLVKAALSPSVALFRRQVDGTQGTSYTVTGLFSGRNTAFCVRASGVDTDISFDAAVSTVIGTGTTFTFPTATTATAGGRAFTLLGVNASNLEVLEPAGDTELAKHTPGTGKAATLSTEVFAVAGATGTRTWTTSTAASLQHVGVRAILRPDTGAQATVSGTSGTRSTWFNDGGVARQVLRRTASAVPASPTGITGTWNLIFDEQFRGSTLDTTKWSTGWYGSGITGPVNADIEDAYYDPARVTVSGSNLNMNLIDSPQTVNGVSRRYGASLINSNGKFEFTFGAFEARIYLPAGTTTDVNGFPLPANWPAFWAAGQPVWPTNGEIDVMEGFASSVGAHFIYSGGNPGITVPGNWTGWHTYAAEWEPDKITYYYDGVNVGQITTGITAAPMYLILDYTSTTNPVTKPTMPNTTMLVDYVRVWQRA